jgi:hypothetical protein
MYALLGAAVAGSIGVIVAVKIDPRRLWPLAAAALGVAGVAYVALMVTPRRSLPVTTYEPPPQFEPWFVFTLMDPVDAPRSVNDPLELPFGRLDVATRETRVRALPRDSATMCTAGQPDFSLLERLRTAAAVVRDACRSENGCTATACTDCPHHSMMFVQGGDTAVWRTVSGGYLVSTPDGRALVDVVLQVYEDVQPWSHCGS